MSYIGKYKIINRIGGGYFGEVFYVYDEALRVNKAIKVIDSPEIDKVLKQLDEAAILYKCKNKYIVEVNEANVFDVEGSTKVVIDMEYLPHGSLESYMKSNYLSLVDAVKFCCCILNGLECAHQKEIIHRDIKPANILLSGNKVKLSDFGLAVELNKNFIASGSGYTTHLAPECFEENGESITSKLTDIYAVGITLFRLIHNINNWNEVVNSLNNPQKYILEGKIISKIGYSEMVPMALKKIINKACNCYAEKRYQDVIDFRQALEKLTPYISWYKTNDSLWQGYEVNGKNEWRLYHDNKNCYLKKNNRNIREYTYRYKDSIDLQRYFYKIVKDTSFV